MSDPIGADKRLAQLSDPNEDLLAWRIMDETNAGWYVLTVRSWPHPDAKDATIVRDRKSVV